MKNSKIFDLNFSTESRQNQPDESPQTDTGGGLELRLVEIFTAPPDSAQMPAEWGFLLAEALSLAPWNSQSSLFVDQVINARDTKETGLPPPE